MLKHLAIIGGLWLVVAAPVQAQWWNPNSPQFRRPQPKIPAAGRGLVPTWQNRGYNPLAAGSTPTNRQRATTPTPTFTPTPYYRDPGASYYGPNVVAPSGPEGQLRNLNHLVPYLNYSSSNSTPSVVSPGRTGSGSSRSRIGYDDNAPKRR